MLRNCSPRTLRRTGTLALSLLLAGMSLPAQAISVDNMVVWSASSKPLRMDIELVDLQGTDLRDIRIDVASAAEHARMGLTRPEWADGVRFKVISLDSGKVIARASSGNAIDADFVSFLVSIRGSGLAQLQQVASKVSANGAEPLASPQAEPVAPRVARKEPAPVAAAVFADKPAAKPAVVEAKPAPVVVKPVAAPKPAAVVAEPVAAVPAPAPADMVAAAEADNAEVLADVGAEPTLESLQAERAQLLQQVTDLQTRLTELDQQITALNPEAMPATETPTALAEAETSPAEPEDATKVKLLGYSYFSNVMLVLLGLFLLGMAGMDRMRASKR